MVDRFALAAVCCAPHRQESEDKVVALYEQNINVRSLDIALVSKYAQKMIVSINLVNAFLSVPGSEQAKDQWFSKARNGELDTELTDFFEADFPEDAMSVDPNVVFNLVPSLRLAQTNKVLKSVHLTDQQKAQDVEQDSHEKTERHKRALAVELDTFCMWRENFEANENECATKMKKNERMRDQVATAAVKPWLSRVAVCRKLAKFADMSAEVPPAARNRCEALAQSLAPKKLAVLCVVPMESMGSYGEHGKPENPGFDCDEELLGLHAGCQMATSSASGRRHDQNRTNRRGGYQEGRGGRR